MSEIKVTYKHERRKRLETTYAAHEYPGGAVPRETGWESREVALSRLPDHNKITVCRVKRSTKAPRQYDEGEEA